MMRSIRFAALAISALALAGCVSLLPKSKPAHLYRFGQPAAAELASVPTGTVGVLRSTSVFPREAAGDRILTVTGGQVAYLAESRWAAPATTLWDQAVLAAFDADPGPVRLVSRGEPTSAAYVLRLDVRNFEAHYDRGPETAPEVLVRVRVAMVQSGQANAVNEQIIEARVRAGDNRVSAIVGAYDAAVSEVLGKVVSWTNGAARPT